MKKSLSILISALLTIIIFCTSTVSSYAAVNGKEVNEVTSTTVIFNQNGVLVNGYTDKEGNQIICQYLNGELVEQDIVYHNGSHSTIKIEYFGKYKAEGYIDKTISPDDYGTIEVHNTSDISLYGGPVTLAGTIGYQATTGNGVKKYKMRCTYTTSPEVQTTYTIRSYVGSIATLASILAGALNLPAIQFLSSFLTNLIYGVGIVFTSGMVERAFSDTVACKKTTYQWTLVEVENSSHKKNVRGFRYYVNDKTKHYGETYYEGYLPKDWRTRAMGLNLHNELFTYSNFNIVSWS